MKKFFFLVMIFAFFMPYTAFAETMASSEQIAQILTGQIPLKPDFVSPSQFEQRALNNTRILGNGDPGWNSNNPNWDKVLARVRSDMQADIKRLDDPIAANWDTDFTQTVAANLSVEDAKTILAFNATQDGKDYQAFNVASQKVLEAFSLSLENSVPDSPLIEKPVSDASVIKPAQKPAQMHGTVEDYSHMYLQIRYYQQVEYVMGRAGMSLKSRGITGSVGQMLERFPNEIDDIYQKYGSELNRFDAFNQTPAEKNLIVAMAMATDAVTQKLDDSRKTLKMITQQRRVEWQEFYKREITKN